MNNQNWLATQFESNRSHLQSVAYRMLGSTSEAEDVIQEAWLRLSRSDTSGVDNLSGWLTTVVARVSLDRLRSRKSRREEPLGTRPDADHADTSNPEQEVLLADSVGPALLVVLETLPPAERVAFVLHDMFGVSFDEIAPIVERSPTAARQLASRARRRVQGPSAAAPKSDLVRQKKVVSAFLAASREGDFNALLALLDPGVVLRADAAAVSASASRQAEGAPKLEPEVRGAEAVADTFSGRARFAQLALLDGAVGAAWAPGGAVRAAFAFTIEGGKIHGIEVILDAAHLAALNVQIEGE
jgi:RNA polymerase sigma-70 factor (ECF subfamily)